MKWKEWSTLARNTAVWQNYEEKGLLKACPQSARSYIFLNKTDIPGGREKALAVIEAAGKLTGRKPDFWIAGSIRQDFAQVTKGF